MFFRWFCPDFRVYSPTCSFKADFWSLFSRCRCQTYKKHKKENFHHDAGNSVCKSLLVSNVYLVTFITSNYVAELKKKTKRSLEGNICCERSACSAICFLEHLAMTLVRPFVSFFSLVRDQNCINGISCLIFFAGQWPCESFLFLRFLDHVFEVYGDDARGGVCVCMKNMMLYIDTWVYLCLKPFCACVYRNQF